jgi:mannose-1-phosphate guanylyltransferase
MNKHNNFAVIMAGGIGSRFWPLSSEQKPKQFLDILGIGKSLLQMTFERLAKICPEKNILIVTNKQYKELVKEHLPNIPSENILLEPLRKNTAPCIAYANHKIRARHKKHANIIVAPSDHLILNETEFINVVFKGFDFTSTYNSLVTIGITPSRPETGYGYIQYEEESPYGDIKKVKTFTEKPNRELAESFIESGDFSWNSGIFIWSLKAIEDAYKQYLPEMDELFAEGESVYNTIEEQKFIDSIYPQVKNISIDYGIMEKAGDVYVINADIGWSDLGTWGSLYTHIKHDDNKNAVVANNVGLFESENNMIYIDNNVKTIIQGLNDYIVVSTKDALLICQKSEEQRIKEFVKSLK